MLVCEDHYGTARAEMIDLLEELRKKYEEDQGPIIEPEPEPPKPEPILTVDLVIHNLVNKARKEAGVSPLLTYDEKLEDIALLHSRDMLKYDYFSHTGRDGSNVGDRYKRAGYTSCKSWGENILWFSTSKMNSMSVQQRGAKVFDGWMNSPGHKKNILSPNYNTEGIGVAYEGNKLMCTQNFCRL